MVSSRKTIADRRTKPDHRSWRRRLRIRRGEDERPHARLLLVDEDTHFREVLGRKLVRAGFDVVSFGSGTAALRYLLTGRSANLLLLDWTMRDTSGIEILQQLRKARTEVPIIVLTTRLEQIYEEMALNAGAVDFVSKSRSFPILMRRIQRILFQRLPHVIRGETADVGKVCRVGNVKLLLSLNSVLWKGHRVRLSPTELRIVRLLAERVGHDVRYREILRAINRKARTVTPIRDVNVPRLRTLIKMIRRKFRQVDPSFDRIKNYTNVGYRWTTHRNTRA